MDDIETCLANIMTAVYGEEVRTSIHDAIKQLYDESVALQHGAVMKLEEVAKGDNGIVIRFGFGGAEKVYMSDERFAAAIERIIACRDMTYEKGIPVYTPFQDNMGNHIPLLVRQIAKETFSDKERGSDTTSLRWTIRYNSFYDSVGSLADPSKKYRYPMLQYIPREETHLFTQLEEREDFDVVNGSFTMSLDEWEQAGIEMQHIYRITIKLKEATMTVTTSVEGSDGSSSGSSTTSWEVVDGEMDFSSATDVTFSWDPSKNPINPGALGVNITLQIWYRHDTNSVIGVYEDHVNVVNISQQDYEDLEVKDPDTLYVIPDENV